MFTRRALDLPSSLPFRLGWMSFLNTWPMRHDAERWMPPQTQHREGVPSVLNRALLAGDLDIALVSSLAYLQHAEEWTRLKGLSIASYGPVHSVLWVRHRTFSFSQHPILTPQTSTSSTGLLRHLLQAQYPQDSLTFHSYASNESVETLLERYGNALLIGDPALAFYAQTKARPRPDLILMDLASVWYDLMKTPFIFGVWCVRTDFLRQAPSFVEAWQNALVAHTHAELQQPEVLYESYKKSLNNEHHPFSKEILIPYWREAIQYFDSPQQDKAFEQMTQCFSP